MINQGLILEGGGLRGVYTSGVTDYFLDRGWIFSDVYGVSAGSCVACSYLARQRGRAYRVWADYVNNDEYLSAKNLLKTGEIFGSEFIYDKLPNELDPYDYEAYEQYEGRFFAVATNVATGQAEYLPVVDMKKDLRKVRASSSLPLMAKIIWIGGKPYLDGGVADSIPIRQAQKDGLAKNVIILTREDGYEKKPASMMGVMGIRYRKYPNLVEAMKRRHEVYNETLAYIKEEEAQGRVFVIRPSSPVTISRLEKDVDKLKALYDQGYEDAKACAEELEKFIEQ